MKIRTAEASKNQLDWGLAKALKLKPSIGRNSLGAFVQYKKAGCDFFRAVKHTDPAVCMGLIKEYCIQLFTFTLNGQRFWDATISGAADARGCDTPEQAVARCVISMKLGDEFEVPDELGVV